MTTARVFQLINLQRLSPELATLLKLAHARQKENASTALPKMLRLLMQAEPGTFDAAIDQARHWFTRNIDGLERIEQDARNLPAFEALTPARAEILEGCRQGRLFALHLLQRLNSRYQLAVFPLVGTSQTPGPLSDLDFETLRQEFLLFYAEMEMVENQVTDSALKLVALRRRMAFEAQNLKLEEKLGEQEDLQGQLDRLRSEIESKPKVGNDPNTKFWIHLENEANQREVIALEQRYAELQQKYDQRERELDEVRQIVDRMHNPYLGATVKDIQDLTVFQPPPLTRQAILKRIQKLKDNGWLPERHDEEKNTLYFFDPEQVKLILLYPRKKKPV